LVFGFGSFLLGSLAGNLIRSRLTGAQVQFAGRKERETVENPKSGGVAMVAFYFCINSNKHDNEMTTEMSDTKIICNFILF